MTKHQTYSNIKPFSSNLQYSRPTCAFFKVHDGSGCVIQNESFTTVRHLLPSSEEYTLLKLTTNYVFVSLGDVVRLYKYLKLQVI